MNATTRAYDRRDCEMTQMQLDLLEQERDALQVLFGLAVSDDEHDRLGHALDQCSNAIGQLKTRLHEVGGGGWL